MKTDTYKAIGIVALLLMAIGIFSIALRPADWTLGSVGVGDQYLSTTTPQAVNQSNLCRKPGNTSTGVLGSVNITKAGTGDLILYDATTSNVSLRTNNKATTTLILATFPATAVGSYHFDISFDNGLLIEYTAASVPTTTISYRCEG